jgi:hypothetical protein
MCAVQSGCCCRCGLPFFMAPPPPQFVVNIPDPPIINPPPVINPPVINPPIVNPPPVFKPPIANPPPNNPDNPFNTKEYVYKQSTGQLTQNKQLLGMGYSGKGQARNNFAMQGQRNLGPIPVGSYAITGKKNDEKGEPIVELLPQAPNNAQGRFPFETFRISAETNPPGNAPAGDIVMPRDARQRIETGFPFPVLKVVQ